MVGLLLTGGGIPVIGLLMYYETQIEKLCQYCTVAHLANIIVLVMFVIMFFHLKNDTWNGLEKSDVIGE